MMIGNYVGHYLEVDMSFEETERMLVAQILVNLDVRKGFLEEMNLEVQNSIHTQVLNYEGIPFRFL